MHIIILWSIWKLIFFYFVQIMELFVKHFVLTRPNKMMLQKKYTYIHILDVACTLVIHIHILRYLWYNAVLCAYYLINGMYFILHNKTPFSFLYPYNHVPLPPQVVRCTYFVLSQIWISYFPVLSSIYLLDTLGLKKSTSGMIWYLESILSPLMLPFLSLSHIFLR